MPKIKSDGRRQQTISRTATVSGFGYWSGKDVRLEFRPAAPHSGITFVRSDFPSPRRIPARVEHRVEMPRRTTLAANGASVEMVEHVLAALYGLHVDNCEIWVDSSEMPGADGSSQAFVTAILEAGIVEQAKPRKRITIKSRFRVGSETAWIEAAPSRDEKSFSLGYTLDYGADSPIGRRHFQIAITPDAFQSELAQARTFILEEEAIWLRERGLGQKVSTQDLLVFGRHGLIDNHLRFDDECVRHKMLDVVGDLSLIQCDLVGEFTAFRSGHKLNAELVNEILFAQNASSLRKSA